MMCVSPSLTTAGYFFSDQPFLNSETIEAAQLAIMLGCDRPDTSEVILEISPKDNPDSIFRLVLRGCARIVDQRQQPVPLERLRSLPINELASQGLQGRGWQLAESPYFEWLRDHTPLRGWRSSTIASSWFNQLDSLRNLLGEGVKLAV